jgi:predicted P-loop ATPase
VFCGTVNDEAFLRDLSGNTRFGVIPVTEANLDSQRDIDKRQLWAQLMTQCEQQLAQDLALENGFARPWLFTREEIGDIEQVNEGHRQLGDAEVLLHDLYDWQAPEYLQPKDSRGRLGINPQTTTIVLKYIRDISGAQLRTSDVTRALLKLTGRKQVNTEVKVAEGDVRKGRLWAMPPTRGSTSGAKTGTAASAAQQDFKNKMSEMSKNGEFGIPTG